jgi:hypothetical protein
VFANVPRARRPANAGIVVDQLGGTVAQRLVHLRVRLDAGCVLSLGGTVGSGVQLRVAEHCLFNFDVHRRAQVAKRSAPVFGFAYRGGSCGFSGA